jgi:hypothetical protein
MIRWLTKGRPAPPEMPPRPPECRQDGSAHPLALAAAWMTVEPLRPEFDPCGAGPMARASSKSGESR